MEITIHWISPGCAPVMAFAQALSFAAGICLAEKTCPGVVSWLRHTTGIRWLPDDISHVWCEETTVE